MQPIVPIFITLLPLRTRRIDLSKICYVMYSVELNPAHNQKKGKKKSISSVLSITRSRYCITLVGLKVALLGRLF